MISGVIGCSALGIYWYHSSNTSSAEPVVIRKLKHVVPVTRNPLKDRQSSSCPENKLKSLRLKHNDITQWKKTHEEFFTLDMIQVSEERRLKGGKEILPLTALLTEAEDTLYIDFTDCRGRTVTLSIGEIDRGKNHHFLGLNNKGMMKLMKRDKKGRYLTMVKAVTEINLRDQ